MNYVRFICIFLVYFHTKVVLYEIHISKYKQSKYKQSKYKQSKYKQSKYKQSKYKLDNNKNIMQLDCIV